MNVHSHLFVLAYLPLVLIVWRLLGGRLKNRTAALGPPVPFRYYPAFSCFEEG